MKSVYLRLTQDYCDSLPFGNDRRNEKWPHLTTYKDEAGKTVIACVNPVTGVTCFLNDMDVELW